MRRDAQQRRAALLAAAEDCFRERGFLVPLEAIAQRAGVGRGTLYRNFAGRLELVLALFDDELARVEQSLPALTDPEQAIRDFVLRGARMAALYNRLAADMPADAASQAGFQALQQRALHLLEPVIQAARAGGRLREGIAASDILLLVRMVGGVHSPSYGPEQLGAVSASAFRLVAEGVFKPKPAPAPT